MADPADAVGLATWILAVGVGLLVGSFLNVVIVRVPEGRSVVSPPSACGACGAPVKPYDNIPVVSWLILRGRCRACGVHISVQYPLIEAANAALWIYARALFGPTIDALLVAVLLSGLLALSVIDVRTLKLPNRIVFTLLAICAALIAVATALDPAQNLTHLRDAAIGAAAAFGFFFLLSEITYRATGKIGMGMGDVKLSLVLGLVLGWFGLRYVVVGIMLAFVLGSVLSVGLMATGRATRKTRIPFGVFLALGTLCAFVVTNPIADWYLGLGSG